jgi:hypothetical protein
MSPGDEEGKITCAAASEIARKLCTYTLSTFAMLGTSAATAECKLPGNLYEAVKRGWEIIHFRTETNVSEPG